jgi:hypothetical protein
VSDPKGWVQSPVDAFILARLQEKKLNPSPQTDRRTLIRRATYDLTGLPPTPSEVEAFLADPLTDAKAFEKVVDRLLESPQYGERWARKWLDVARYADTTGDRNQRGDNRYPFAWTYRDYVVNAFNQDKPFNQFILEQLAADRLPKSGQNDSLAALGFLTVGKRFMNNPNDIIDDRIDVVSQGLLGLTVACARCHDHKFDPIPTTDYYALHGVFNSSMEPPELPMIGKKPAGADYEDYQRETAKVDEEIKLFRQRELDRWSGLLRERFADYLLASAEMKTPNDPRRAAIARKRDLNVTLLEVFAQSLRKIARTGDPVLGPWQAFANAPESAWKENPGMIARRLAFRNRRGRNSNPVVLAAFEKTRPKSLQDVAQVYQELFAKAEKEESQVPGSSNANAKKTEAWAEIRGTAHFEAGALQLEDRQIRRLLGNVFQRKESQILAKKTSLDLNHPGSPARAMAVVDSPSPRNSRVLIRGERGNLGPEVPRGFLQVLSKGAPKRFTDGSGRLELARAIASPENPLTARVLVNRAWQKHFGEGLALTPNDFGLRSEPPTHPELLDFLASWFMENGWSMKKLDRLILLSSVYQQSSLSNPEGESIDPENKWLWRMNLRRLDFEETRDSLLAAGGKIDLRLGGAPFPDSELETSQRRTIYCAVDRQSLPEGFRIFDFANPDMCSGQRYLTTVPQQALFFMNGQLAAEQARKVALRASETKPETMEAKVSEIFRILYQRPPSARELDLARKFFAENREDTIKPKAAPQPQRRNKQAERRAAMRQQKSSRETVAPLGPWERYTQALLASNEFMFVN